MGPVDQRPVKFERHLDLTVRVRVVVSRRQARNLGPLGRHPGEKMPWIEKHQESGRQSDKFDSLPHRRRLPVGAGYCGLLYL
jgi:hypothetical protein